MQAKVPKFASFRNKAPAAPRESQSLDQPKGEQARSHHHSGRRQRSRGRSSPKPSRISGSDRFASHNVPAKYPHGYTEELFMVDYRGDIDNARYGTNSKWHIPIYREPYDRFVLGAKRSWSRHTSGSILAKLGPDERALLNAGGRRIVPREGSDVALDPSKDFVSLGSSRKRKRGSPGPHVLGLRHVQSSGVDGSDTSDLETDVSDNDELIVDSSNGDASLRKKLQCLQARTKLNPSNVEAWLDYIDFQEEWATRGLSLDGSSSGKAMQSTTVKLQLSILTDALKAVRHDQKKCEILLLHRLALGRTTWGPDTLREEWENTLEDCKTSIRIRHAYILYRQTDAQTFDLPSIRQLYSDLFSRLDLGSEITISYAEVLRRRQEGTMQLILLLKSSGFHEMVIAICQAQWYANVPSRAVDEYPDLPSMLKWWEEEGVRPGDKGSQYLIGPAYTFQSPPSGSRTRYDDWATKELSQMQRDWVTTQTNDEEDDFDDPYRIVLFSDLEPFWHPFGNEKIVIDTILCVCGLPKLFGSVLECYPQQQSPARHSALSDLTLSGDSWLACTQTLFAPHDHICYSFKGVSGDEVLVKFASNIMEEDATRRVQQYPQEDSADFIEYFLALAHHLSPKFARKTAKSMLDGGKSAHLRLYLCLALIEARSRGPEAANQVFVLAIKMSKFHTETQRVEALLLWSSWIQEAMQEGNVPLALRRMASIGLEDAPAGLVMEDTPSQSQLLRVRDYLRRARDCGLDTHSPKLALHAMQLLLTLTHITKLSIPATKEELWAYMAYLQGRGGFPILQKSLLHQHFALLLHTHVAQRLAPYSPRDLAEALAPSISLMPDNGLILNIYAKLFTHGSRLDDRVRSVARQVLHIEQQGQQEKKRQDDSSSCGPSNSIVPHVFAIQTELARGPELGSTSVSIRAAFERAVASAECAHYECVWAMYLEYECSLLRPLHAQSLLHASDGEGKRKEQAKAEAVLTAARNRVKSVFYRGISSMPWNKDWAMGAFAVLELRLALTKAEKKAVIEGMSERGLRLHNEPD